MARTAITLNTLAVDSSIAAPAGNAIDQANGMNLAYTFTAIPANPSANETFLIVSNTAGSPKNVIVRAGIGGGATPGQAFRSGLGDLTVSVTNGTTVYIGPLRTGRFEQLDSSINVDFQSGMTGNITAVAMPIR